LPGHREPFCEAIWFSDLLNAGSPYSSSQDQAKHRAILIAQYEKETERPGNQSLSRLYARIKADCHASARKDNGYGQDALRLSWPYDGK